MTLSVLLSHPSEVELLHEVGEPSFLAGDVDGPFGDQWNKGGVGLVVGAPFILASSL